MSVIATKWAYSSAEVLSAGLSSSELLVLRALCWYSNDTRGNYERSCFPGVKRLCRDTGLGPTAVNDAKRGLGDKGFITWTRGKKFGPDAYATNSYQIECPELLRKLKANHQEARYRQLKAEGKLPGDDLIDIEELEPLVDRPPELNVHRLANEISGLSHLEATWLLDALRFVGDTPNHRTRLLAAYRAASNPVACAQALGRVKASVILKKKTITSKYRYLHASIVNLARK